MHTRVLLAQYVIASSEISIFSSSKCLKGCSAEVFCTALTMVIPMRYKNATTSSDRANVITTPIKG